MGGHGDHPVIMTRRYGNVGGEYGQVLVCPMHDGDAFDADLVSPMFGKRRCSKPGCANRWEHDGACP